MFKKISILFLCMALLLSLPMGTKAYAEGFDAKLVSAYRTDNMLHSFVEINNEGVDKFKASPSELGGSLFDAERYTHIGAGASYVVLMDVTMSMEDHAEACRSFLCTLAGNKSIPSRLIVLPYTEEIIFDKVIDSAKLNSENISEDITTAMEGLGYKDADNYSCKNIVAAYEWLETELPIKSGEILNFVLVTDNLDDAGFGSSAFNSAKEKIAQMPEVLFHSVIIGRNDGTSRFDGKGAGLSMKKESEGEAAANALQDYVSKLYRVSMSWNTKGSAARESVEWFWQYWLSGESNKVNNVAVKMDNVALLQNGEAGAMCVSGVEKAEAAPAAEAGNTDTDETPEEAATTEGEADDAAEPASDADAEAEESPAAEADGAGETEEAAPAAENEPEEKKGFMSEIDNKTLLIGVGAFALIILIIIICVLSKGKKKKPASGGYGIPMQLEVLSGKCKSKKREFNLSDELVIGRAKNCDIVFADSDVSDTNTRVYIKEGFVYIDDLGSTRGTSIEGMRIYSPNRLRSGNEISIGNVRFRFNF